MNSLRVTEVRPNSHAARAGIRVGDILLRYNDRPLNEIDDLIYSVKNGNPVNTIKALRNTGEPAWFSVPQGALGAMVIPFDLVAFQTEQEVKLTERKLDDMVVTTAPLIEGSKIIKSLDIVTVEYALGSNIVRGLAASLPEGFVGRSESMQKVLGDARKGCLRELRKEALSIGGNAIVAVDLKYIQVAGERPMLMLVASGTAVCLEETPEKMAVNRSPEKLA